MKRPTRNRPATGSTPRASRPRPHSRSSARPDPGVHRGGAASNPAPRPDPVGPDRQDAGDLFAGRYRIERKLGKGGMGSVYLANQIAINRSVAIKVLDNAQGDHVLVSRFTREARVIAQLQHPNIVHLIDFGESEEGRLYLVMEYIDGDSLKGLIKREAPLEPERVVRIGYQVADALAAAHAINVIHRDLKPDNVMLASVAGRTDFVKILDFGIAKVKKRDPGEETVQTKAGLIVGSLRYISPEQVETREITPRTDLYSYGCILYELLAGRRVFEYPSPADCAIAHLTETPKPPERDGLVLEGPLVDLIMQCLDKDEAHRPQSAEVVREMLRAMERAPLTTTERTRPHHVPSELPTAEEQDVHHSATIENIEPGPVPTISPDAPTLHAQPASEVLAGRAQAAPPAASADAALAPRGGASPRITDCALDLPRRLGEDGPRGDVSLRRPTGQGYAIVAAQTGAPPQDAALIGTPTHTASIRLEGPAPPPAQGQPNVVLWVLAFLGLAAIGALIFILIIHPAMRGDSPPTPAPQAAPETAAPAPEEVPEVTPEPPPASAEAPPSAADSDAVPADAVHLVSVPPGVSVFRDGETLGDTPLLVRWEGDGEGPRLRLVKSGYVASEVQLSSADRGTERTITLKSPMP